MRAEGEFIQSRRGKAFALAAMVVALSAGSFRAHGLANSARIAATPNELIEALDAPDLAARAAATRTLISLESVSLAILRDRLVRHDDLSPEQIARLTLILEERFASVPAVMGISMRPVDLGLEVSSVVARSPAAELLRAGDVILALDEQSLADLNGTSTLHSTLARKMPGDTVELLIVRNGERLTIDLELADGRRLGGFTESDLDQIIGRRRVYWREWLTEITPPPIVLPASDIVLAPMEATDGGETGSASRLSLERRLLNEQIDLLDREIGDVRALLFSETDPDVVDKLGSRLTTLLSRHAYAREQLQKLNEQVKPARESGAGSRPPQGQ